MKKNTVPFYIARKLFNSYSISKTDILLENILSDYLDEYIIENYRLKSVRKTFNEIIINNYPNETTIKANFINQKFLRNYKQTVIFELNVGTSRVDLCKINRSSTAFEIKTDLDNLNRLSKQMEDYFEIFEKVMIICSKSKLNDVEKTLNPLCGIFSYSLNNRGGYKFKLEREAVKNINLNAKKQLSILPRKDLIKYFSITNSLSKEEMILQIIQDTSEKVINNKFKFYLKEKYQHNWNFILENQTKILEIDYQWFFKNMLDPDIIYKHK